jgi:hypothetical protein
MRDWELATQIISLHALLSSPIGPSGEMATASLEQTLMEMEQQLNELNPEMYQRTLGAILSTHARLGKKSPLYDHNVHP